MRTLMAGCALLAITGCQERPKPASTEASAQASAPVQAPGSAAASASAGPAVSAALAASGPPRVVALGVGDDHTFAVYSTGQVKAWGDNRDGKLALDKKTRVVLAPTVVPELTNVVQIDGAGRRSCAVLRDGTAQCWGNGFVGALGDGKRGNRTTPAAVLGVDSAVGVQIARGHGCALLRDGSARCWGMIAEKEPLDLKPRSIPKLAGGKGLVLGGDTSFAWHADGSVTTWDLELGKVWEYGSDVEGQYDNIRNSAKPVKGIDDAQAASASSTHVCVLRRTGTLACWGSGDRGQLGDGLFGKEHMVWKPKAVADLSDLSCVAVGLSFTCACDASGQVFCWGRNEWGQLGLGDQKQRLKPELVAGLEHIVSLAVGDNHSCALDRSGAVYCWGKNLHGQIGDGGKGVKATRLVPTRIEVGAP